MEAIVASILRQQNEALLESIAIKFNLDPEHLKSRYLTPSFYSIDSDHRDYVIFKDNTSNSSKDEGSSCRKSENPKSSS